MNKLLLTVKKYWEVFNGWQWFIYVLIGYNFVAAYTDGFGRALLSAVLIWALSRVGYYAKESEIKIDAILAKEKEPNATPE